MTVRIVIPPQGEARALYSPQAHQLLAAVGTVQTRRASRVEPSESLCPVAVQWLLQRGTDSLREGDWWADLLPVQGPVLGPFETRDAAVAAELVWLQDQQYPFALQ
jgi:hypothetical protein